MTITLKTILNLNESLTNLKYNHFKGVVDAERAAEKYNNQFDKYPGFYQSPRFTVDFNKKTQIIELNTYNTYQPVDAEFLQEMRILQDIITTALGV